MNPSDVMDRLDRTLTDLIGSNWQRELHLTMFIIILIACMIWIVHKFLNAL
jgi:uncharacterized protein with PQ loop repeat